MSGGEPSSIKRNFVCAVSTPGLSWLLCSGVHLSFEDGCAVLPRTVFIWMKTGFLSLVTA